MEAQRHLRLMLLLASVSCLGASFRTENFMVTANDPELARQVAQAAEQYRQELAVEWLGEPLPRWQDPCPIMVHSGPQMGAGGQTSFMFDRGRPFGWEMMVQGTPERILDSVLPHEVTHAIFATHFGCPLPRWADEGACTTVEHSSERNKQHKLLLQFLTTGRGIAFNHMFAMREYPADILPLYSQGYSLARFLIQQGGKQKFVTYVGDGLRMNNWTAATQQHYGYDSLGHLQNQWLEWVRKGSPQVSAEAIAAQPAAAEAAVPFADVGETAEDTAEQPEPTEAEPAILLADKGRLQPIRRQEEPVSPFAPGSTGRVSFVSYESEATSTSSPSPDREDKLSGEPDTAAAKIEEANDDGRSYYERRRDETRQAVGRPQPPGRPRQRVQQWQAGQRRGILR